MMFLCDRTYCGALVNGGKRSADLPVAKNAYKRIFNSGSIPLNSTKSLLETPFRRTVGICFFHANGAMRVVALMGYVQKRKAAKIIPSRPLLLTPI